MENSRTKNSVLIMATSGVRQLLTLLLSFANRTVFIYVLGARYLGINGLFSNILAMLSLAELGIGSAISYYLYKPIALNDKEHIKSLMQFYKKCYRLVGLTILGFGCLIMPFLDKMVNLNQPISENLYLIYFLFLLDSAFTYLFWAYKQAIMFANQQQYKIEKINIGFAILCCCVDIIVLLIFKSFIIYLLCNMAIVIIKNIVIAKKIDRAFPYLKEKNIIRLSRLEVKNIFKGVFNESVFKLGSTLFNSTLNIIVSIFIGTIVVGYYSNYYMIIGQVGIVFGLIMGSIIAGIGNVVATETAEKTYTLYKQLDMGVFLVNAFCTICMFQLLNSFIHLWLGHVGRDYILGQVIVGLMCLDFYLNNSCQVIATYRTAAGQFKIGRDRQVIAGIINIPLSIGLIKLFGLAGAFMSPVLCKLFITVCPFLIDLEKKLFQQSWNVALKSYSYKFGQTVIVSIVVWLCCSYFHEKGLLYFVIEVLLTVLLSIVLLISFTYRTTEVQALLGKFHLPKRLHL